MHKAVAALLFAFVVLPQSPGVAQSTSMAGRKLTYVWREEPKPAKPAVVITAEDVQTVLKSPGGDHQIAIVDAGKFNLCVGARRTLPSPTAQTAGTAPAQRSSAPASQYPVLRCGANAGTLSGASGISHDEQTETYVIIAGTATLVTGGVIVNGTQSGPDAEPTRVLNGPSCSGAIGGEGVLKRAVKPGDIAIIPPNTPHGWLDVKSTFDYILVRQDPDHALPAGYVHPSIASNHQ